MASIPLAPAVCRRLDLQHHSLAGSTSLLLLTISRWTVETSDLAGLLPGQPSTDSHLANSQDDQACLAALLLHPECADASRPASLFAESLRSARGHHYLLSFQLMRYH